MLRNPHLLAMLAICLRICVFGASIGDALAVAAVAGLYGYTLFLDSQREEPVNETVKKDLQEIKATLSALKMGKAFGK